MALKIETEIVLETEPSLVSWDNQLFVGSEDGSIKTFDAKLSPKESWTAHTVQPFTLVAYGGKVYSSSNDGGVKIWTTTGDKVAELPPTGADVTALRVFENNIYAGDESGHILVYENNEVKAQYNVLEEVKDLWFSPPYLFTVRDLYVTVTEITPDESKTRFITKLSMEGRAPLRIVGNRLVFVSREGKGLVLHDASYETHFKKLHEVKASDMIITCMSASGDQVWTGSWDGIVRRWKISGDKLEAAGEISLEGCINSLAVTDQGAYVAVTGGKVMLLTA